MSNTFKIIQIILAILLVILILLQQRGSGLGAAFGGGDGNVYRSRRGIEKMIFYATIVVAVLFCIVALFSVFFS
ncbi:MAG: preprotein translocase subunit SecG [Patescibacteria group bacterium]|jgi:preprotein translocase subunit SecG